MALIRCTECKAKVSDKATTCPKCGAPVEISKKKQKSQISTGCGCLIVLLAGGAIISAIVGSDGGGASSTPPPAKPAQSPPKQTSVTMPSYTIVDRDKYDAPVKTQIELHAVVSGSITESGLKALLQELYKEATATRGFKYHGGKPTHIFIYLYTSRDHFTSGMGQWIAMLSKVGADSRVDTRVKTELIAQLTASPEQKHGLSESKRKEIFRASVTAEDRAAADAERLHPIPDPSKPGYSQSQASAQVMKQAEALNELTKKYNSQVARRYGISDEQLTAIAVEGIKKNWPMP
jgi:ribosomal protein L40E